MPNAPDRNEPAAAAHADKSERVRRVVDDFLRKRAAGVDVSSAAIVEEHPDLTPELAEELRKLAVIDKARSDAEADSDDGQRDAQQEIETIALATALYVRCPHCNHAFAGDPKKSVDELRCAHCGEPINLVNRTAGAAPRRIGRFELIEQLGMGSFGTVWRALDAQLEREVAVKIPRRQQLNPLDIEEVMREARVVAQLNHAHIVRVHEVGREEDTVYIVSNLIRGRPLHKENAKRPLTFEQSARLCQKVAIALQHAHSAGVIHRDLKPANIMVDEKGEPCLTDFGLAKNLTEEISMTLDGHILGTPAYMSPEQAAGDASHCDARSDVYSLGVVLYELLTDELPFRGNMSRMVQQVLHDEPPPPRKLNGYVPRDLETICLKCMEKDPQKRYQTAGAVAAELGRFLANEPILARPVSRAERLWRAAQRRPLLAAMIATSLALLVVLAVGGVWGYLHERAMRRELGAALTHEEQLTASLRKLVEFVKNGEKVGRYKEAVEAASVDGDLRTVFSGALGSKSLAALRENLRAPRTDEENQQPAWRDARAKLVAHPDRRPLQSWIEEHKREQEQVGDGDTEKPAEVFAWFVQDSYGLQIARAPKGRDNLGNCYAWRSYFHGGESDYADLRDYLDASDGRWPHLQRTQVSMAFKTRQTNEWVVAISTPVYADGGADEFLGVIGVFLFVTPPQED